MSQPRIEMNAVILPNGKVLALGGSLNDEDISTASLNADLTILPRIRFLAGANAFPRLYHSVALLLPDATVWVAGGNPNRGSYVHRWKSTNLPTCSTQKVVLPLVPTITGVPSNINYGNTFTIQSQDPTISSVVLVRNGTVTHAFGMDQRMVGLSFTAGSGSLTVTAPPNSNIAPPGYYMLFALNSAGVPSRASFVQVTTLPPDFTIAAIPSSRTIAPGAGTTYSVKVTSSNGFDGKVSLSLMGLPTDATATFNPVSFFGRGTSTLLVTTLA